MKYYAITFRSITFAQRGAQLLEQGGIRSTLMRTPQWMEDRGCGYCLSLRTGNVQQAANLLRRKKLPYGKIYVRSEEGSLEEWKP